VERSFIEIILVIIGAATVYYQIGRFLLKYSIKVWHGSKVEKDCYEILLKPVWYGYFLFPGHYMNHKEGKYICHEYDEDVPSPPVESLNRGTYSVLLILFWPIKILANTWKFVIHSPFIVGIVLYRIGKWIIQKLSSLPQFSVKST